jgi:hypothetical protein
MPNISPGQTIDETTADAASGLLPDSVLEWVKRGDYVLQVAELDYTPTWGKDFLQASERNGGRYALDPDGRVLDTNSQRLAPFIFGLPFPAIDRADADAGTKVMWNRWYVLAQASRTRFPFQMLWIDRKLAKLGVGRTDFEEYTYYCTGRSGEPAENAELLAFKQVIRLIAPFNLAGITRLQWRYLDERSDRAWLYNPTEKKVRPQAATDGSDAFFGTDLARDDVFLWFGRNEVFHWNLVREQDVLVPANGKTPNRLVADDEGGWRSDSSHVDISLGYGDESWQGAPWAPTKHVWVKRPVYVLEALPKRDDYRYGRQVLYVDRENFLLFYKIIHDRAGRYLKTVHTDLSPAWGDDGSTRFAMSSFCIGVDESADRACALVAGSPEDVLRFDTPSVDESMFSTTWLVETGR